MWLRLLGLSSVTGCNQVAAVSLDKRMTTVLQQADLRTTSASPCQIGGTTVTGKFEIYRDGNGQYRFRFRAGNGEIVATGGSYPTKADAKRAVAAVMHAAEGSKPAGKPH